MLDADLGFTIFLDLYVFMVWDGFCPMARVILVVAWFCHDGNVS